MQKARALRAGDRIRLVTPASPISAESVRFTIEMLEANGFLVDTSAHAFSTSDCGYLAAPDTDRAEDLMQAFADSKVQAIYCTRGGYGTSRLMPYLDLDMIARTRKLFIGYSDATVLHLALQRRGVTSLYAPMPLTFTRHREEWVLQSFLNAIQGKDPITEGAPTGETMVPGRTVAPTVGGCLCLLTDSIGTSWEVDTEGKILLIEDVDEPPHRVDAMLTHLIQARKLERCAGLVVGEMTRTDQSADASIGTWDWRRIVRERIEPLGIPSIIGFPFGHMTSGMLSLPLGAKAELDATAGTLRFIEPFFEG
jgi:muramoyltetrapeptide carboxypeptidase